MDTANTVRPTGRKTILRGETWGQHDPIRGEWTLKPNAPAFQVWRRFTALPCPALWWACSPLFLSHA